MAQNMHEDHRKRVKQKFLENGFSEATPDHEILEMLLFYAIARKDTNTLAHQLIDEFGSLSGVINAPISALTKINGISEHTAILIKLVLEVAKAYTRNTLSTTTVMQSSEEIGTYLLGRYAYFGTDEVFSMLSLNNKGKLLSFDIVERGDLSSVGISIRKVVEVLIKTKGTAVVIAHNHPGGIALPSDKDVQITAEMKSALAPIGVHLLDHIIIASGDYVSLFESEKFKYLFK